MPEAAKAHTKVGAKAFIVYYWQVVDYATAALDTRLLRRLSAATCVGCDGGIRGIARVRDSGGRFVGGGDTVADITVGTMAPQGVVSLAYTVTNTRQKVLVPGKRTVIHPSGTTRLLSTLSRIGDSWRVMDLREPT